MTKIFLQIGATRDGQNPYCAVAKRKGYFTVLAEMGNFVDYQSLNISLPFDLIVRLDHPENPRDVLDACLHAGLLEHPQVVLAGFEAYNVSAGRVRELLAGPDAGQCFIPPDKFAQRMALRKAQPHFPQPEFRFFASPLSIGKERDALLYPCVIKPVDGGGGLGIWLVEDASQLDTVIARLLDTMNYGGRCFTGFIIESWLEGEEYSLQGVVENGQAVALTCCQKVIEHQIDTDGCISFYESGHVAMAAQQLPVAFTSLMNFCCETFGYQRGAFHIDFIMVNNEPHFLEMGFRLSGMGVVSLVEETTGINWADVAFQAEVGHGLPALHFPDQPQTIGRLRLRQRLQYDIAQRWIAQHQRGQLLPPLNLPALDVAQSSSLYADLTRHSGILATLRLCAASSDEVLAVFHHILGVPTLASRKNVLCAE